MQILKMQEENDLSKDGTNVKFAGIISEVKKKFTKNNTRMAFVTVEDLHGSCEVIVFDSCYSQCSNILCEDSIVLVEGRLSIREDEEAKIVARTISELKEKKNKKLNLNITNLNEEQKEKLRGAIRYFAGDNNNIILQIENQQTKTPAGGIYLTQEILKEFEELIGQENVSIVEE